MPDVPQDPTFDPIVKGKLLELLETLGRQGHMTLEDVAGAFGRSSDVLLLRDIEGLRRRVAELEPEVIWRRGMMEILLEDHEDLASRFDFERSLVLRSEVRIQNLERRLADAQRIAAKLVAASKTSLVTLKKVRGEHPDASFALEVLGPIVRDLGDVARVTQELRAIALIRAQAENPDALRP